MNVVLVVAVVLAWLVAGLAAAVAFHFWRTREQLRGKYVRLLMKAADSGGGQVVALLLWGLLAAGYTMVRG